MFKPRDYRQWIKNDDLVFFEVREKETDLGISAERNLEVQAREAVLNYRAELERYIEHHPEFFSSLEPVPVREDAPAIVRAMADSAEKVAIGPMAAVAGAVAEYVAKELMVFSRQVIVENGGDIFLATAGPRILGIYAGERSPFTGKLAIELPAAPEGLGVCTSSGTVSHSLSFGGSDAAIIIAESGAMADAVATATGNILKGPGDIARAVEFARSVEGVRGVLALAGETLGSWGEITLV